MKNNNSNKLTNSIDLTDDNIVETNSTSQDSNIKQTPWFKKRSSIIAMSSILGVSALATTIAIPVALTSTQSNNQQKVIALSKVINVYDETLKTAKLIVTGTNLPDDKNLYSVFKVSSTNSLTPIKSPITFKAISLTEINLDFVDDSITNNVIYQVKLKNDTSTNNEVSSKVAESIKQPTFTITTPPASQTIEMSSNTTTAVLEVIVSSVVNELPGEKLSYQWYESNTGSTANQSEWHSIKDETSSRYKYDITNLALNVKKYFKCVVNYKYATPIITTPVYVEKINTPIVSIVTEPSNVDLAPTDTSARLSVVANVLHGEHNLITYQWESADSITGAFTPISNATLSTYTYTDVANLSPTNKKYFRCIVGYLNATPVTSKVVSVSKQLLISISVNEPSDIALSFIATSANLAVVATATNGDNNNLTYQWEISNNENSGFANVVNGTLATYTYNDVANLTPTNKKYFRCTISYPNLTPVTTRVIAVSKNLAPILVITKQIGEHSFPSSGPSEAPLSIEINITNPIAGQEPTYKWYRFDNKELPGTLIRVKADKKTYRFPITSLPIGETKYFKCEVTYAHAGTYTSEFGSVTKTV